MNRQDLADLIFPGLTKTIEDYEEMYPERNLGENAKVTRFAPSPTGFMHIGNFMPALIDYVLARQSNGIFYLRNEDTDTTREVEGAIEYIRHILEHYHMEPNEYEYRDTNETKGNYAPYIQSERKEIYQTFIKHLLLEGKAYPCFLTQEEMDVIREGQAKDKRRIGIYGRYAKYRDLPVEEAIERIKNGESYTIRLKSNGDFNRKFKFNDLANGEMEFPENDIDIPIMKSKDGLPTYHFAHLVDDHLMHTTHVVRGQEWISSIPVHFELFKTFGFKMPKYIHIPLLVKKDGESVRKLSKRLDPEARMSYYEEKGYPYLAVIEAIMTIANSNYEAWREGHPDAHFTEFEFSPKKMSASGALFDLDKLDNISKNYISRLSKEEVYDGVLSWSKIYDEEFSKILEKYKDYSMAIYNIEREQKKPRKDYTYYSEIKDKTWYMYEEYFDDSKVDFSAYDSEEVKTILTKYKEIYHEADTQEEWFTRIKEMCDALGYASDMKTYKNNPENYKGSVVDVTNILRIALTTLTTTPDLYSIMQILGKEKIFARFDKMIAK